MINPDKGKTLGAFYSVGGLRELIPIYPLYAIMFGAHGIGAFELSVLFAIWAAVGVVLEVPSGALADTYSRKWLIVLSGLLKAGAFITWYCWQEFWGYALGFVLWGIASSLRSGAFEALLFEVLDDWQNASRFAYHYGRIRALGSICVMVGEACGGLLIIFGYDVVLLVSAAIPIVVSLPFCFYVKDVKTRSSENYAGNLAQAVKEVKNSPVMLFILLISTFLLTIHGIFDEYIPPLFLEEGFAISTIAFLAILVFAAQALGEFLSDRFIHLNFGALLKLMVIGAFCLVVAAYPGGIVSVIAVMFFFFIYGLAGTIVESKLQAEIRSESRATVTSLISWGDSLGAIIWFLIFGLAAGTFDYSWATSMLGLLTIGLCLAAQQYRLRSSKMAIFR